MYPLKLIPALLAALLILAACGGQPAAETADAPAAPVEETSMEEAAMDDDTANDGDMDDDAEHGDEMDDDAEHADSMDDDEQAGDMDDTEHGDEMAEDADHADEMGDDTEHDDDMDKADEESMDDAMADEEGEAQAAIERPAWQQIALTDARTGEQFTLADYGDKVVFVESFATWCGNCRRQLGNVQAAHSTLGDDAVFVALSVEPNIANEALVSYADKQGYGYTFAAMPPEMLQELSALFGQTIANPPATPHFIIRPDGSTTEMVTGFEGPDVLVEQIQAAAG